MTVKDVRDHLLVGANRREEKQQLIEDYEKVRRGYASDEIFLAAMNEVLTGWLKQQSQLQEWFESELEEDPGFFVRPDDLYDSFAAHLKNQGAMAPPLDEFYRTLEEQGLAATGCFLVSGRPPVALEFSPYMAGGAPRSRANARKYVPGVRFRSSLLEITDEDFDALWE